MRTPACELQGDSQKPFRAALRREVGFMKASIAAMGSNAATILAADSFYRAIAPDVVKSKNWVAPWSIPLSIPLSIFHGIRESCAN